MGPHLPDVVKVLNLFQEVAIFFPFFHSLQSSPKGSRSADRIAFHERELAMPHVSRRPLGGFMGGELALPGLSRWTHWVNLGRGPQKTRLAKVMTLASPDVINICY